MKSDENISNKLKYTELICCLSILFSFTGSSIVFLYTPGMAITAMRLFGGLCLIYSFIVLFTKMKTELYNALLIIFILIILVSSCLMSPNKAKSLSLVVDYLICFGVLRMIVYTVDHSDHSEKTLKKYLSVFYIGLIITIIVSMFEYFTGIHIANNYSQGWTGDTYYYLLKAPTAFLYNPNNIGVLMVLSIPLVFLFQIVYNFKGRFFVLNFILFLILATVFMTGSRGALLAALILLIPYILFSKIKVWAKVIIIVGGYLFVIYGQNFIFKQLIYGGMIKNGALAVFNEGDGGRSSITATVINNVFKHYPIFGAGAGGVEAITGLSAHNLPVEIISNFGVVGGIFVFFSFIAIIINIKKISDRNIRLYLFLIILAILLTMLIPPTYMTLHFVWVIIGFVLSYIHIDKKRKCYEEYIVFDK